MATTGSTTRACSRRAGRGGFQFGGRVGTSSNSLLQFFNRRRGLRGGSRKVGAAVWRIGAPLRIAPQVQRAAVGQLQGYSARQAGQHLLASKQAVTFDEDAPSPFRGYGDDLTNNAFDDGNNAAHWTLRIPVQLASMPSRR
ncbi:hypothetical protein D9M71_313000 [compost metagenome]